MRNFSIFLDWQHCTRFSTGDGSSALPDVSARKLAYFHTWQNLWCSAALLYDMSRILRGESDRVGGSAALLNDLSRIRNKCLRKNCSCSRTGDWMGSAAPVRGFPACKQVLDQCSIKACTQHSSPPWRSRSAFPFAMCVGSRVGSCVGLSGNVHVLDGMTCSV